MVPQSTFQIGFLYFLIRTDLRNAWLLLASLFFYAWGEVFFSFVMVLSILVNYSFGLWVSVCRTQQQARWVLALTVLLNIGLLAWYKYANFFVANLNGLLSLMDHAPLAWTPIHLPIGISFFTFQALSYVFDVYRGQTEVQRNPFHRSCGKGTNGGLSPARHGMPWCWKAFIAPAH